MDVTSGARVGFIGLGTMGAGMAGCVLRAGFALNGFDVSDRALRNLVDLGASATSTAAECAADAVAVVIAVVNEEQVRAVLLGADGALAAMPAGSTVIVSSTVSPQACQELAERASQKGVRLVDAPVSGGTAAAQSGSLTTYVGGRTEDVELVDPILRAFSTSVIHTGPVGSGELAKVINNAAHAVTQQSVLDAITLGRAWGMDPSNVLEILRAGSGRSWLVDNWTRAAEATREFPNGSDGMAALLRKDLQIALDLAREAGEVPAVQLAADRASTFYTLLSHS